ncbi:aminomethyl transferase family protein [Haloferax mediterranei ATCC 33500]|uniref:Aminomethyl transferase family protein n=1 Tax=Haloferax mediterranei (strain ATCC 33500 / DSM 1411 / JCM 8866 / NBRC 14739 / NCIMB 2177 / R-4) TaxID=523841 RepID=I3R1J1_HALMT|nr:glycine cleavage T C-terminal barrel domain-containing protein [Haloferax mediterranei]AFK18101.1 aminomethyltransferase, glycine cleavage system T protein [Haloferax mediterranei ATCC 33500]AHZ22491.1 glycine cleavage system protein T [Haloferax mediterranei ATCC 33500]EMA02626.1 aminomethyltransferase, glycine cleavage system T protein [Haloferax mediterranei ATCC 33500]MDX5988191.1 aminomethyltransferase family protein [Haloferax mediterranei ATCC 33500]QCQ74636.1 aminomethyl transferase
MTLVADIHEAHGATFETRGGVEVVSNYGRPERTHRAVRNGVGVIEHGYGVVVVEGEDRIEYVDNAVTNTVPAEDGEGVYALLLDPDGRIETELYIYNAGERLLLFTPRDRAEPLVEEWRSKTFLQRVRIRDASDEFGVFGVHGPQSTEKVASILSGAGAPEPELSFVRGSIGGELGVTVVASDNPTGEEGYDLICRAQDAEDVFEALLLYGNPAIPLGYQTWDSLTAEAGTPLFETELRGNVPNVVGLRHAIDFDKGCFVGQEVVSKVENRGQPSRRLVGFRADERPEAGTGSLPEGVLPETGADVLADGDSVGTVTRAVDAPVVGSTIGFALVGYDLDTDELAVVVDGEQVPVTRATLPFVEGSARSARIPAYLESEE